ncbi:MAG: hypothetical protein QW835_00115 [Candidatus Hadarchaeum sp.]
MLHRVLTFLGKIGSIVNEFVTDATGKKSLSRLCLGVVVLVYIPVYFVLYCRGVKIPETLLITVVSTLAGIYAVNSGIGIYKRNGQDGG